MLTHSRISRFNESRIERNLIGCGVEMVGACVLTTMAIILFLVCLFNDWKGDFMSAWDVYWFTRLDIVLGACVVLALVSFAAATIAIIIHLMESGRVISAKARIAKNDYDNLRYHSLEDDEEIVSWEPLRFRIMKLSIPVFFLFLIAACAIPNSNQVAAIYLLPKIANNEQVQQIPDKALKLMEGKMDEWLDGLRKEKK